MSVALLLSVKGNDVFTVPPDTLIRSVVSSLAEHGIGAVLVLGEDGKIAGICSERDVVKALAEHGSRILSSPVREIMTTHVSTCRPKTPIGEAMRMMTDGRFRHLPVVDDDALIGIISIGDVVKQRIAEIETERAALTNYIMAN